MKIANRNAREYVRTLQPFTANNLYAENAGVFYVVYSYGEHWPLWVYDGENDCWYENDDKYSSTTSKHKSQTRPIDDGSAIQASVQSLIDAIRIGKFHVANCKKIQDWFNENNVCVCGKAGK